MPFFSRNSDTTTTNNHNHNHNTTRDTTLANQDTETTSKRRSLFHRNQEDPSIVTARERLLSAEAAEREADRALAQARVAVREARENIKRLEKEAAEEARLARKKQDTAKSLSNRGKHLGRHEHV